MGTPVTRTSPGASRARHHWQRSPPYSIYARDEGVRKQARKQARMHTHRVGEGRCAASARHVTTQPRRRKKTTRKDRHRRTDTGRQDSAGTRRGMQAWRSARDWACTQHSIPFAGTRASADHRMLPMSRVTQAPARYGRPHATGLRGLHVSCRPRRVYGRDASRATLLRCKPQAHTKEGQMGTRARTRRIKRGPEDVPAGGCRVGTNQAASRARGSWSAPRCWCRCQCSL